MKRCRECKKLKVQIHKLKEELREREDLANRTYENQLHNRKVMERQVEEYRRLHRAGEQV